MNQWPGSRILPTRRGTGNRQITSLSQDGKKRCQRGQSGKKVAYYRGDKNSFYAVIYSPMLSFIPGFRQCCCSALLYPLCSGASLKSHSPISPEGPSEEAGKHFWNQKGNKRERRTRPHPGEVGPITKLWPDKQARAQQEGTKSCWTRQEETCKGLAEGGRRRRVQWATVSTEEQGWHQRRHRVWTEACPQTSAIRRPRVGSCKRRCLATLTSRPVLPGEAVGHSTTQPPLRDSHHLPLPFPSWMAIRRRLTECLSLRNPLPLFKITALAKENPSLG